MIQVHTLVSPELSAKRDNCELPGRVSALLGRFGDKRGCPEAKDPEAEEGREFRPHAWDGSGPSCLSVLPVDGRVLEPDEPGRPKTSGGELTVASILGERMEEDEFHAFGEEVDLLPHVVVPLRDIHILTLLNHQLQLCPSKLNYKMSCYLPRMLWELITNLVTINYQQSLGMKRCPSNS